MQVQKKDNNIYVKELDKIEQYLLNIIERFFESDQDKLKDNAEYIIMEAVKRAKKEIIMSGKYGVTEVNGKTGNVTLYPGDIGAEPAILVKRTAYNKNFGDQANTVCEGNDPRLSDSREPLPHDHDDRYVKLEDYSGLTQDEKDKLASIEAEANKYIHPTDAGNKHIPAGGAVGQILTWLSDGTAEWNEPNILIDLVTHQINGLMSSIDKIKLDGIEENANNYIHPPEHPATMITQDSDHRFVTDQQIQYWDSKAEVDMASPYTHGLMSKEHFTKLDNLDLDKRFPTGDKGQVYYIKDNNSSEVELGYITEKACVVENINELNIQTSRIIASYGLSEDNLINVDDIYDNWERIDHFVSEPDNPYEKHQWHCNGPAYQLKCRTHSWGFIGFVSNEKYEDNYTLEVDINSDTNDTGYAGVILAYAEDQSGIHTLSVIRNAHMQPTWAIYYDFGLPSVRVLRKVSIPNDTLGRPWNQHSGCKIRIERNKNLITAYTSNMGSNEILSQSKMQLDITNVPNNPSLTNGIRIFLGPSKIGFGCRVLDGATFSNPMIRVGVHDDNGSDNDSGNDNNNNNNNNNIIDADLVYNAETNEGLVKNNSGDWVVDANRNIITDFGVGKFIYSETNKKLFYIDDKRETTLVATQNPSSAKYVHPVTPGSKHIPAGGSSSQILRWSADGEAVWGNETAAQWGNITNRPTGNKGQVYYISEDSSPNVKPAYLLVKASVVENEKELKEAKEIEVDFQEVFNSWQRFSHNGAITPANPSEMNQWRYDASTNTVKCTINSVSYIGFISNEKYDEYTLELTISSTDGDDDRIGIVVAYAEDQDGTQHTISALRQTEGKPYWMLVYDYLKPTQKIIASQNIVDGDVKKGWSSFPRGCKIRVERTGDLISVFTSPMGSDTILQSSKLSVNLSSATYLNTFRGPKQYGYSCQSQNSSTFSNIKFESGLGDVIYDISSGETWVKDDTTKEWVIDASRTIETDIGVGKFVFNENTEKLFFIDSSGNAVLLNSKTVDFDYGDTSRRPNNPKLGDAPYFDRDLNKPIWWNGSTWVDAMGNNC